MPLDEAFHLNKPINPSLPYHKPVLVLFQHLIVHIQNCNVHGTRSKRSAKHKYHLRPRGRATAAAAGRRREEMRPRRRLRDVPPQRGPDGVAAHHTPPIGEERGTGLEPHEDQLGEAAENRVGDAGGGVLLLHDELHAGECGGEADGECGVPAGADDDVGPQLPDPAEGGEEGAEEAEGEEQVARGEQRPGEGGGGDGREAEPGRRRRRADHAGVGAEEEDPRRRLHRPELLGDGDRRVDMPAGAPRRHYHNSAANVGNSFAGNSAAGDGGRGGEVGRGSFGRKSWGPWEAQGSRGRAAAWGREEW